MSVYFSSITLVINFFFSSVPEMCLDIHLKSSLNMSNLNEN
jgi:hypothetical protein